VQEIATRRASLTNSPLIGWRGTPRSSYSHSIASWRDLKHEGKRIWGWQADMVLGGEIRCVWVYDLREYVYDCTYKAQYSDN